MMSAEPQPAPGNPAGDVSAPVTHAPYRWFHRFGAVLFATFCLEVGFFLLIFPWSSYARDFAAFRPEWRHFWDNGWVRAAISGLGLANLYISCVEIHRLRRFARRH